MANSNEIESLLSTVLMYTHMVGVLYILYRGLLVLCASYTIRIYIVYPYHITYIPGGVAERQGELYIREGQEDVCACHTRDVYSADTHVEC